MCLVVKNTGTWREQGSRYCQGTETQHIQLLPETEALGPRLPQGGQEPRKQWQGDSEGEEGGGDVMIQELLLLPSAL